MNFGWRSIPTRRSYSTPSSRQHAALITHFVSGMITGRERLAKIKSIPILVFAKFCAGAEGSTYPLLTNLVGRRRGTRKRLKILVHSAADRQDRFLLCERGSRQLRDAKGGPVWWSIGNSSIPLPRQNRSHDVHRPVLRRAPQRTHKNFGLTVQPPVRSWTTAIFDDLHRANWSFRRVT